MPTLFHLSVSALQRTCSHPKNRPGLAGIFDTFRTSTLRHKNILPSMYTALKERRPWSTNSRHRQLRRLLPATAPPSRPNCRPSPDFFAGGAGALAAESLCGTAAGGPRSSLPLASMAPSPMRSSLTPTGGTSSPSTLCRCALLALSCTLRNFSSSSTHRMAPSSRLFSRFGLS